MVTDVPPPGAGVIQEVCAGLGTYPFSHLQLHDPPYLYFHTVLLQSPTPIETGIVVLTTFVAGTGPVQVIF